MTRPVALTPAADHHRPMPASRTARLDASAAAVTSLEHEQLRLSRLGFELPLARCEADLRFWRFVHALHSLPRPLDEFAGFDPQVPTWPARDAR